MFMCANPHAVEPRQSICSVFALDDGLLILSVPVLKLGVELDGNDLQVAWIMVPGEVAVYTDYIHIRSLRVRRMTRHEEHPQTKHNHHFLIRNSGFSLPSFFYLLQ